MDEMNNKSKIEQELSKVSKDNPFGVPDNYFDDFYARLHVKLEAEKRIPPDKEYKLVRFLKPALGLVASFALIFLLVYWPIKTFLPNNADNLAIEITDIEYFSVVDKIDENTFYDLLEKPDNNNNEFSDEELVNYLSANVSEYEIYLSTNY